jgi:hypothetical protein
MKEWLTTRTGLVARKALIAFITGFLGVLIPAALQILDAIQAGEEPTWTSAFLISLVAGAFAAGVRAVLALSPLNLSATDKLTSLGSHSDTITVTTRDVGESSVSTKPAQPTDDPLVHQAQTRRKRGKRK